MRPLPFRRHFAFLVLLFTLAVPSFAQDVMSLGNVLATTSTIDVPLYVRDVSGTPLGIDRAAGFRIQAVSAKVSFAPMSAISSATIQRAGILAGLTPVNEVNGSTATTRSWIAWFDEASNPVPFHLDGAAPGDLVAVVRVTLASSVAPGTRIDLGLDTLVSALNNQTGTLSETTGRSLVLVNGSITVGQALVTLTPPSQTMLNGSTATMTVTVTPAPAADLVVTLSSSTSSVALSAPTVTIPAGQPSATFTITGSGAGSSVITASLPGGGGSATANVTVVDCVAPGAVALNAPQESVTGTTYTVSWSASNRASEYIVDESTDASFASPTTRTTTATSLSFSHAVSTDTRYYYRVRSRNAAGGCDLTSDYSTAVSVLVRATSSPILETRVVPVVASLNGDFGSVFKTAMQLYNPTSSTITGRLIYHPIGVSGTDADPSLDFSIASGKTLYYADFLPLIGQTGLGSLDIVAESSNLPVSSIRMFNDAGAAGTTGMAEDQMRPDDAVQTGQRGILIAPPEPAKARFNIGVRTLSLGARMTITVRSSEGAVVATSNKELGPSTFIQQRASDFLGGTSLSANDTITFRIDAGSAFIYGATNDNTTNDPSLQFAKIVTTDPN